MKKLYALIAVALLFGIIYQAANLSGEYGSNLAAIRSNLGKSGYWRGANFNQSQKVADYIEFLNRNIPENARVIIPSLGGDSKVLVNPYMQFFLAPREVANCLNVECLQSLSRDETYIVIVGNLPVNLFPDASTIMFDEYWGLLPPKKYETESNPEIVSFNSLGAIIQAVIGPLLWMAGLALTGTAFTILLLPGRERYLQIALGYGLGLGLFSMTIVLLSLLGFNLNTKLILVSTGTLVGIALSFLYWGMKKHESGSTSPKIEIPKSKFDFWPLIFLGLGGIAIILAVGKGYHRIDAIQIWGAKGYGIAAVGSFHTITDWGTNTLPYPLHIPALIAGFRVLFGDLLPSSKLIFGGYYLAIMMIGYYALLGMGVRRWLSGLAVLLMVTTPILFRHGTIGYANLPFAFCLLSGVVVFLPVFTGRSGYGNLILSGLFLAFAAWTRPEGLMLSFFVAGLLLLFVFLDKRNSLEWGKALRFLTPLVIYFLIWIVVKAQIYPEPLSKTNLTSDALNYILKGELHIQEVFFIFAFLFQELVTSSVWGAFGIILLVICIFVLIFLKCVSRIATVMITIGGILLLLIVGMYYLTSYDSAHDLSWWVRSGLDRMIFPGLIVLWLGLIGAFHDILESSR